MSATATTDHGAEILARSIRPDEGGMSAEAARAIIRFKLAKVDADRVNELASKARAGSLTAEERSELDDYERITALLELMQSKARLSLKQAGLSP
jgi:hypothetical protein